MCRSVLLLLVLLHHETSSQMINKNNLYDIISSAMCEAKGLSFDRKDDEYLWLSTWKDCIDSALKDFTILPAGNASLSEPTLVCRGEGSFTVKWKPPIFTHENQFPIVIYVFELSSSNRIWQPLNKTKDTIITIKGLVPETTHQVRVRAIVAEGQFGPTAQSKQVTTLKSNATLNPIQHAEITRTFKTGRTVAAVLNWKPSPDTPCNYEILTWIPGSSDLKLIEIKDPRKLFEVILSGLNFDTNYTVAIRAKNDNWTKESDNYWLNFITPSCLQEHHWNLSLCAPDMPMNLSAIAQKNKGDEKLCDVYVLWSKPPAVPLYYNVTVTHYSVPFSPLLGGHRYQNVEIHQNVSGNETKATFIGLQGGSRFRVVLVAVSEGGKSEEVKLYRNSCISSQSYIISRSKLSENYTISQPSWVIVWLVAGLSLTTVLTSTLLCVALYRCRSKRHQKLKRDQYFKKLEKNSSASKGPNIDKEYQFDDEHEIARERIIICHLLGTGAFGIVHKGLLTNGAGPPQEVAVKTLRDNPTGEEISQLEKEINVMKSVGFHKNVVSMVGCCTRSIRPLLIIEFCDLGDLQKFLREAWKSMILIKERSTEKSDGGIKYAELVHGFSKVRGSSNSDNTSCQSKPTIVSNKIYGIEDEQIYQAAVNLTASDLLSFARQIAIGMEFLSNNRVVHRDLAARNVLVSSDLSVKISDFGLSRDVYERNFYSKKGSERLPVKWMALESFLHQVYTTQSDVWSFGVLLWEIVTLGGNPYPSTPTNQIFRLLKQGYRMERPSTCNQPLYEVMLACWAAKPKDRPTFTQLVERLDKLLEDMAPQEYLQLDTDLLAADHEEAPRL